jgi:hypothetical protein
LEKETAPLIRKNSSAAITPSAVQSPVLDAVVETLRNLSCGILLSSYGDEELAYRLQASQIKLGRGAKLLNDLGMEAHGLRWRRKFGQLAKVGSTSMKYGLYDWEAEAVLG